MEFSIIFNSGNKEIVRNDAQDWVLKKIAYLNIIQGIVTRLANTSVAIKAANVTASIGLLAYSVNGGVNFQIWMLFPVALFFAMVDCYFLQKERAFIVLYNNAAMKKTFDDADFVVDAKVLSVVIEPFLQVFIRGSVAIFYSSITLLLVIVFFFSKRTACVC